MKAGIAIESWKKDIFHKHLTDAGYAYTESLGLTLGTMILYVMIADEPGEAEKLTKVIQAANSAAARRKLH